MLYEPLRLTLDDNLISEDNKINNNSYDSLNAETNKYLDGEDEQTSGDGRECREFHEMEEEIYEENFEANDKASPRPCKSVRLLEVTSDQCKTSKYEFKRIVVDNITIAEMR
ncbi:hypothetical protein HAX54_025429 [Datura stramonium]|uniref:Uncharacterized protein n=1 Tax=Datura stramonium TaxID=4076 RepID=A0ABS8UZH5_DATST|nr:hypothetical protein [Datura stramonium]